MKNKNILNFVLVYSVTQGCITVSFLNSEIILEQFNLYFTNVERLIWKLFWQLELKIVLGTMWAKDMTSSLFTHAFQAVPPPVSSSPSFMSNHLKISAIEANDIKWNIKSYMEFSNSNFVLSETKLCH